jgi:hypothetical protein
MVRIGFALLVALAFAMGWISGTTAIVLSVVAAVMLLTGLVSFCPAYRLLGLNTCRRR